MSKSLLITICALSLYSTCGLAQCAIQPTATASTQTFATAATGSNPMAFIYHPGRNFYYSIFGGSAAYGMDVWNATGTLLSTITPIGYDFRGVWWTPNTSQLEGSGYNNVSVVSKPLDASGYPVASTVNTIYATANGLSAQNVGAYDPVNNEIIYYSAGTIKRVSRATNATISSMAITGLPATTATINSNVVLYTGCAGKEYALYNSTTKAVYFISRATNAYVGTSQLPATAAANASFGVAYTRDQLYLFNYTTRVWNGYTVLAATPTATLAPGATAPKLLLSPNPAREQVQVTGASGPVRLLDMTGRIVREQPANSPLLVKDLAAGIYLVQSGASTARLAIE